MRVSHVMTAKPFQMIQPGCRCSLHGLLWRRRAAHGAPSDVIAGHDLQSMAPDMASA